MPAYSPHAVAEHAVALLLTLNRKIHRAYTRVRELNFSLSGLVGFDLHGKTVGIVGSGRIGRAAAEIFRGFGCRVLASDPAPMLEWAAATRRRRTCRATRYWRRATSSACTCRSRPRRITWSTPSTLAAHEARRVPRQHQPREAGRHDGAHPGAQVGATWAAWRWTSTRRRRGLFFEDLSGEVLQDDELSRLLTFPNVLITAHQGFLTREALTEIARVTVENVLRLAGGRALPRRHDGVTV